MEERVERKKPGPKPKNKPERPARVPMGAGLKLAMPVPAENGYHYRWVQDRDGRLGAAEAAWYEYVKDESGNRITRSSGPHPLILMRIKQEYYDADQELKLKESKDTLKKEQELGQDEYIPDGKHHVLQKDEYDPLG